ncbi:Serine/threonine-protein kinase pakA [Termitomyces sp. J132]|nr:Serine/threonine-protein kinase pakA [Termitomyces sp. J132]
MSWDEGQEDVPRSSPLWDDIEGLLRPENARSSGRRLDVQGEAKRESSRSSTSTVIAEPATIGVARSVSVVRKVGRYVVGRSPVVERREEAESEEEEGEVRRALPSPLRLLPRSQPASPHPPRPTRPAPSPPPPQPLASSSSSPTSTSGSTTSGNENSTPLTDEGDVERGLDSYYWDGGTTVDEGQKQSEPSTRPRIVVSDDIPSSIPVSYPPPNSATSFATTTTTTPLSPLHRYRGWLSSVVEPLEQYIDDTIDPREFYLDLQEIAEGDSGSVYAARLASTPAIHSLRLPPRVSARDADDLACGRTTVVAIKSVAILPSGSPKLVDLERELGVLMGGAGGAGGGLGSECENVLGVEAVYVDLVEDALWIRMELMERSLADVVGLVPSGLVLGDRSVARFASDVLQALEFLQRHRIAHRDVRSDNLLVNSQGVLKLTDFSNAVRLPDDSSMSSDPVGVPYWQAPEIRSPPYDALQVDVWSLGATVWEMAAEAEPPFAQTQQLADRWPPLSRPHLFSSAYHEFLRLCEEPYVTRPSPAELCKHPFINNACGRQVIVQLISQCMTIEQGFVEG